MGLPSWPKQQACPLCHGVAPMSACLTRSAGAASLLRSIGVRVCTQWRRPLLVATRSSTLACSRPPGVVEVKGFARCVSNMQHPCIKHSAPYVQRYVDEAQHLCCYSQLQSRRLRMIALVFGMLDDAYALATFAWSPLRSVVRLAALHESVLHNCHTWHMYTMCKGAQHLLLWQGTICTYLAYHDTKC